MCRQNRKKHLTEFLARTGSVYLSNATSCAFGVLLDKSGQRVNSYMSGAPAAAPAEALEQPGVSAAAPAQAPVQAPPAAPATAPSSSASSPAPAPAAPAGPVSSSSVVAAGGVQAGSPPQGAPAQPAQQAAGGSSGSAPAPAPSSGQASSSGSAQSSGSGGSGSSSSNSPSGGSSGGAAPAPTNGGGASSNGSGQGSGWGSGAPQALCFHLINSCRLHDTCGATRRGSRSETAVMGKVKAAGSCWGTLAVQDLEAWMLVRVLVSANLAILLCRVGLWLGLRLGLWLVRCHAPLIPQQCCLASCSALQHRQPCNSCMTLYVGSPLE